MRQHGCLGSAIMLLPHWFDPRHRPAVAGDHIPPAFFYSAQYLRELPVSIGRRDCFFRCHFIVVILPTFRELVKMVSVNLPCVEPPHRSFRGAVVYNNLFPAIIPFSTNPRRILMKLTPGKLAGLKAVSNDRGVIAAAAMDQRGSLQKSLAKEKGGEISV